MNYCSGGTCQETQIHLQQRSSLRLRSCKLTTQPPRPRKRSPIGIRASARNVWTKLSFQLSTLKFWLLVWKPPEQSAVSSLPIKKVSASKNPELVQVD